MSDSLKKTNALEQLTKEGVIRPGWAIFGGKLTMRDGDKKPTREAMDAAYVRFEAERETRENRDVTDRAALLQKLGLSEAEFKTLCKAILKRTV